MALSFSSNRLSATDMKIVKLNTIELKKKKLQNEVEKTAEVLCLYFVQKFLIIDERLFYILLPDIFAIMSEIHLSTKHQCWKL